MKLIFDGGVFEVVGVGWGMVSFVYLFGGFYFWKNCVISWYILGGMLLSVFVCVLLFYLVNVDYYVLLLFYLFNGVVMVGVFFIVIDLVLVLIILRGCIIFGVVIGFWVVIICIFGGYFDVVVFVVIIMNMVVFLIDYYICFCVYGKNVKG